MNKTKRNIVIVGILLVILFSIGIANNDETILIQLSAQGSRQMMGYILKTDNDKIIVIDGGTTDDTDNLAMYINELGGKVDYWFITHAHDDHAGAFVDIVNDTNIEIDNIYIALNSVEWYMTKESKRSDFSLGLINTIEESRISDYVIVPRINDNIKIDNINVEILKTNSPEVTENAGNEQSMVLKLSTQNTSILFLGDTGKAGSNWLIENQKEKLDCDIVQMSHHGQDGATRELYEIVKPEISLWPTPEWLWNNDNGGGYNSGSWKTLDTRKWMKELGVNKHYVSKDGDTRVVVK